MQGVNPANAQARQLLDGCSRTITVTRLAAAVGVNAFRVATGAFPEFRPGGAAAAAVVLPAASDEFPTPFFRDGIRKPESFIGDGDEEMTKKCGVCASSLLGQPDGDELAVDQPVMLRQLMCHQRNPQMGAVAKPVWWTAGGDHYFPHLFHGECIEAWFQTKLQQHQQPVCPECRSTFEIPGLGRPIPSPPVPHPVPPGPLVSVMSFPLPQGLTHTVSKSSRMRARDF